MDWLPALELPPLPLLFSAPSLADDELTRTPDLTVGSPSASSADETIPAPSWQPEPVVKAEEPPAEVGAIAGDVVMQLDDSRPYACPTCSRRYMNANGLKYHAPRCDPNKVYGPIECPFPCSRSFKQNNGLRYHVVHAHHADYAAVAALNRQLADQIQGPSKQLDRAYKKARPSWTTNAPTAGGTTKPRVVRRKPAAPSASASAGSLTPGPPTPAPWGAAAIAAMTGATPPRIPEWNHRPAAPAVPLTRRERVALLDPLGPPRPPHHLVVAPR